MSRMPTTAGARRTRDRVLDAALELFNDRGSAAVTTNHIAAEAGISPGNLYYWFSDKDEIVRELYARLVAAHEGIWAAGGAIDGGAIDGDATEGDAADGDAAPGDLSPGELLERLSQGAELSRQYAFLARDLLGLLHADPVLAADYAGVRARRLATFTALARTWRAEGVIHPIDDDDVADLVQALWIIAETWFAFGELNGAAPEAQAGSRLLRIVLAPHLN